MNNKQPSNELGREDREVRIGLYKQPSARILIWKMNTLWLARQHRADCCGEECNISLLTLMEMAKNAGVEFTKEELKEFL
jgi:hypothetical protein